MNQKDLMKSILGYTGPKTEDDAGIEAAGSYRLASCPYETCDGSGILVIERDGHQYSKDCQCLKEQIFCKKLRKANLEARFAGSDFAFGEGTGITHFKPFKTPKPYKGKDESKESPDGFIKRHYDTLPYEKGVSFFGTTYTDKTLHWLDEFPRTRTMNLLLFGESGSGKTHLASVIGSKYIEKGKTVYFSSMQDLLDRVYDKELSLKELARKTDLLIIDEIYNEYHTDTNWALKNIKELFKIRLKEQLPIICTSNGYPHEFYRLYGKSMMSMFNGTFFIMFMESATDYRIEQGHHLFDEFGM